MTGLGELAGLGAATSWGIASHINSAVARRTGATCFAMLRLPGMLLLCGLLCAAFGVDTAVNRDAFLLLSLSGFLGIGLGDIMLYRAILIIGPTMGVLVLSLSSGLTAVVGWLFLGEALSAQAALGIVVTLAGIAVVVLEHSETTLMPGQAVPQGRRLFAGVLWAAGSAVGLAVAYIAQRMAMQTGVAPLWGGFLRTVGGGVALWGMGLLFGWIRPAVRCFTAEGSTRLLLLFGCSGGAVGIWAASYALAHAPAGVAATIIGLQPIVVAISGAVFYRRKPSGRVLAGSLVAFAGTALVCMR